jgi:hypothetical protein
MRRAYVIALLPLLLASARADDKPDLQTILDAWKAREKAIESFDFHWRSKRFYAAQKEAPKMPDGTIYPKRPASTFFWQYRLASDSNGHSRFEDKGHTWNMPKGDFSPTSAVGIYESNNEQMIVSESGDRDFPQVVINRSHPLGSITEVRPVNMALRPLTPAAGGFDRNTLKLSDEIDAIDNVPLLILTDSHNKIWVDPSKDFLPVKCIESGDHVGFPYSIEFTIAYAHDASHGWLPKSWALDSDHGNLTESATVTEFTVDQSIPAAEFSVDFPHGAIIIDGVKYTLAIAYPDGKRHELKPGEFTGKNFQDLLNSEPNSK